MVDSRKGRDRFAIGVESTLARYIRAIHAHRTVGYGGRQARDPSGSGERAAIQAHTPAQRRTEDESRVAPAFERTSAGDLITIAEAARLGLAALAMATRRSTNLS